MMEMFRSTFLKLLDQYKNSGIVSVIVIGVIDFAKINYNICSILSHFIL